MPARPPVTVTLPVTLSLPTYLALVDLARNLDPVVFPPGHGRDPERAAAVLAELADRARDGWTRPGSWERPWLQSALPVLDDGRRDPAAPWRRPDPADVLLPDPGGDPMPDRSREG